ncbi:Ig-like domain-containing protein [Kribbella sancticallisti]|uniref:Ig-like domain-containing protein n=1 Tax=Kribbella sancticallisti TaxID=460087 RepID=A0ABP4PH43_9ACTN
MTGRLSRRGLTALALAAVLLVVSACQDTEAEPGAAASSQSQQPESQQPESQGPTPTASTPGTVSIDVTPKDKATKVSPAEGVQVKARSGRLGAVTVTDAAGQRVSGRLSADGTSWISEAPLKFATRYTVAVSAAEGAAEQRSTFTTVTPKKRVHTAVVPLNGETVGVGLPIQVSFNAPVTDRAAAERNLKVVSTPAVAGSWRWISDRKIRYRPQVYWPAGTKVTLKVGLRGVNLGRGVYGDEQREVSFTVGRSVVSVVDGKRLRMTVFVNGKPVRTIPVTMGKKGWETRNGVKVVLEKFPLKVMDGATLGIPKNSPEYYRLDVRWAVRMTWSGEFVHGAPWSTASQGTARVSHGCVGMSLENAQWYFGQSLRGDVIKVVNSPTTRTMELDNGFGDWNLSWQAWRAGSALR